MEKKIKYSKVKRFFINLALNLPPLIPAVSFGLISNIQMDYTFSLVMLGVYIFISVALPMIINIKYCSENSSYCFVHWWVIMSVVAVLEFEVQFYIYYYVLNAQDTGGNMLIFLMMLIIVLIALASLVYQIILIIKCLIRWSKNTDEIVTE